MLSILFAAIVSIESGGNCLAVGDKGKAVGPAQIWEITVRDCNRILGEPVFRMEDRFSLAKSKQMFDIYTTHYGKRYGMPISDEVRAKVWNGGPTGPNKQTTQKYWNKIKAKL